MKNVFALAVLFLIAACASTKDVPLASVVEQAFTDACELSAYTCEGVDPPVIRLTSFARKAEVVGFYVGGSIIWVAEDLDFTEAYAYAVLVHETVHYLQNVEAGIAASHSSRLSLCAVEEEAYKVSNQVLERLGQADKVRQAPYDPRCA